MNELVNYGVSPLEIGECEKVNGGLLFLLPILVEVACYAAAGDIILNFNSYADAIEAKMK